MNKQNRNHPSNMNFDYTQVLKSQTISTYYDSNNESDSRMGALLAGLVGLAGIAGLVWVTMQMVGGM